MNYVPPVMIAAVIIALSWYAYRQQRLPNLAKMMAAHVADAEHAAFLADRQAEDYDLEADKSALKAAAMRKHAAAMRARVRILISEPVH